MATQANLEVLNSAHQALLYAGDFMTCDDPRAWVRKSNILLDACFDCGMSHDEPDHVEWASGRVTQWLFAA